VNTWKVILATLVIFGAGVMTGGLLVNYAVHTNLVITPTKPIPVTVQGMGTGTNPWSQRARELLRRMDRELNLTPEQHQRIEKLIAESAERTRMLWKPIAPQMSKEMQILHRDMREELTPEQRPRFDEIFKPRAGLQGRRFGTNQPPAFQTNSAPANP
jgi:Spy/CpxP family protein refolding chaperone